MSDRLAKQVASVIVGPPVMGDSGRFISGETLSALAELVEWSETLRQEVNELAPLTGWPPGMVMEWDEALRRVAETLGITQTKENT